MSNLPNPPWRVLASNDMWNSHIGHQWWIWDPRKGLFVVPFIRYEGIEPHSFPRSLVVINHPHNDPEALEIIRKAKEVK